MVSESYINHIALVELLTFSIVTDSASDILPELREKENIFVVPTMVIFGEEEFDDDQITKEEFLNRLSNGETPTTSQPSPNNFMKAYNAALEESDEVLGIHLSSKLSGTFNGALSTTNMIEEGSFTLVDSLNASVGSGYLVRLATQLRSKGYSITQTAEILEKARDHIHLEVLIENIDHLRRGGRVNLGQFYLLKLLRLKPIISNENGRLIRDSLVWGKSRGIRKVIKRAERYSDVGTDPVLTLGHANTPEVIPKLRSHIENITPSEILEMAVCTTLMAHTGPGVAGLMIAPSLDHILTNYDLLD